MLVPSSQSEPIYKVIMLGNSGVGKTCLVSRWVKDEYTEDSRPTVGASNFLKEIEMKGRNVKLTLWDTAGQEQFRSITPLYIRGAKSAVVCVSQIDRESFKSVDQWLELLMQQEKPTPAILAVTKRDLETTEPVEELLEGISGKFSGFFFVSAKTGENVDNMFRAAAALAIENCENVVPSENVVIQPEKEESNKCC